MPFCPCCRDEFGEREEFCPDCCLPLLEGKPTEAPKLCDCDDSPFGQYIAQMFADENMDAAAAVSSLTGIRDADQLTGYIDKLLACNNLSMIA